jgi:predicted MFS family arabinose efflux permease
MGLFDATFGIAWFIGSWLMGVLYDKSIMLVVLLSAALQVLSLPIFFFVNRVRTIS